MTSFLALLMIALVSQPAGSPQAVVDELLAADRRFSAAGETSDTMTAIPAMFADDVVMLVPGEGFARGKAKAAAALAANPDNRSSRVEWTPVRGGISADGRHGFTLGYMTLHRRDGSRVPLKYLAYWIRQPEGWRVAVYKRNRSAELTEAPGVLSPALPARLVEPVRDSAVIEKYRDSLDARERAFSDSAQKTSIGAAFAQFGSDDAVNMGPPTGPRFVEGPAAIGRMVGANAPPAGSHLSWAPDQVIVASSGDLGVTIGTIRRNTPPPAGQPATFPFITVWRRASPSDPWRYVAE